MPVASRRLAATPIAILLLAASAQAVELATLLGRVATNARFDPAMRAEVQFATARPDGTRTTRLTLYGRGRVVRVEMPDGLRALVKPGKCLAAMPGGPLEVTRGKVIGGSAFLLEDLAPFTPQTLRVPQISDQSGRGTVVMAEPSGPSPYVLLVYTIAPDRPFIIGSKFYRWEINNLTKMTRVLDSREIAGHWRPLEVELQDLTSGGDTTTITYDWRPQPDLPASLFTPRGLREDVPR